MNKDSFKSLFSFEFWQKNSVALMVVIAVMPAAGLMISVWENQSYDQPEFISTCIRVGFSNKSVGGLSVTFTSSLLAIGGSWAKSVQGGAFAAGLFHLD